MACRRRDSDQVPEWGERGGRGVRGFAVELFNKKETRPKRKVLRKTETEAEKRIWAKLRDRQACGYKFFRQYGIGAYIADFYCPQLKLVIEIDGGQHYYGEGKAYDKLREEYMLSVGIHTIRFSNVDVLRNTEGVLKLILERLRSRTPSIPL